MAIAEGRPVAASPQCSQQRDNERTSVSQLFPTCSECKQTIILTDKMRRCTNPACGRVVCFLCAAKHLNWCPHCSNLTTPVFPSEKDES